MAVAGGQAVAVVDLDHAGRSRRSSPPSPPCRPRWRAPDRRCAARKSSPVCIAGRPRNGSLRTPKPEVNSTSPTTGLRYGTSARVRFSRSTWARVDVDAIQLALETAGVGRRLDRHERAAHAAARRRGFHLPDVEAEIAEHAAHPPRAGFEAFFDQAEHGDLAAFDLIERALQPCDDGVDALVLRQLRRRGCDHRRGTRLQPGLAVRRRHEDHRVADRGGFWDARHAEVGRRRRARRLADRAGDRRGPATRPARWSGIPAGSGGASPGRVSGRTAPDRAIAGWWCDRPWRAARRCGPHRRIASRPAARSAASARRRGTRNRSRWRPTRCRATTMVPITIQNTTGPNRTCLPAWTMA